MRDELFVPRPTTAVRTELRIPFLRNVHGGACLKPRRQIRQPLRGGINEYGLQVLVEASEDGNNEEQAKRRLDGLHAEHASGSALRRTIARLDFDPPGVAARGR
jgi:hypothetical protein